MQLLIEEGHTFVAWGFLCLPNVSRHGLPRVLRKILSDFAQVYHCTRRAWLHASDSYMAPPLWTTGGRQYDTGHPRTESATENQYRRPLTFFENEYLTEIETGMLP